MASLRQPKVAVVGLGGQGIVTVKNMLEQGFDVTGFDKNEFVGGIWHYCAEHRVSVLPSTMVNISSARCCFTDFPFPDGTSSYATSSQVDSYLNQYCDHFDLRPHFRLSTTVKSVTHNHAKDTWFLTVQSISDAPEVLQFDKLVMALGPHSTPIWPEIGNRDKFNGKITHSVAFKDPLCFKNKRVIVIGVSNTAADTSTSLVGVAKRVYLSHRHGAVVLPRFLRNGSPIDHGLSYRTAAFKEFLSSYSPSASARLLDFMIKMLSQSEFGTLDPQWNLAPAPSLAHQVPTVQERLIPALRTGTITSTAAPKRILDDSTSVELHDGTILEDIDAIICCTGYDPNFSLLDQHDPTLTSDGRHDYQTPRLYQNIFSLQYPDSLAFIGTAIVFFPAFLMADLSSMALAQLWSRKPHSPCLPSQTEMEQWYSQHCDWVRSTKALSPLGKIVKFSVQEEQWLDFVTTSAGTNLKENLSYTSLSAWKFWLQDLRFCNLVMSGIYSPHVYRLFDSDRRKTWPDARKAIEKVNRDARLAVEKRRADGQLN